MECANDFFLMKSCQTEVAWWVYKYHRSDARLKWGAYQSSLDFGRIPLSMSHRSSAFSINHQSRGNGLYYAYGVTQRAFLENSSQFVRCRGITNDKPIP